MEIRVIFYSDAIRGSETDFANQILPSLDSIRVLRKRNSEKSTDLTLIRAF